MPSAKGILKKMGFSELEEAVYLKLLNRGPATVVELAKLVGKHRPVIYQVLPRLLAANLIAKSTRGKRIMYSAESPTILVALAKNRLDRVDEVLPRLISIFQNKDQKLKVSFSEGKEGIEAVYEELIASTKKGEAIYRYESPRAYDKNKRYYPQLYWQRAGATGDIDKFVITNQETHQRRRANLNRFSKPVTGLFHDNITQLIGEGKVIFIDYDTETVAVIESARFANFQKTIFKMLFTKL